MDAYTSFAAVYDQFMDETPYDTWCENIVRELYAQEIRDGLVLELGCGTGSMTQRLAAKGYDMIGVDLSDEMLNLASAKKNVSGYDILYLNQDMRAFELYGTVCAVVSVCDSINYLLDEEDIVACFRLVNNYLDPGGIFMFDFNTKYKYETIGETTIAENREDCSFIWENFYDDESCINAYELTIFVRNDEVSENGQELFLRFSEEHLQRGYTLEEMKKMLKASGLEFAKAYDADTLSDVTDASERIYCIAREKGKGAIK
ncbi:MAG: class I SAM-dependent methyltransferase [Lachnospiraceae bacterium]|nr:class I SAM-dependent methyltransferase [Lachnospiraceae bacterium]